MRSVKIDLIKYRCTLEERLPKKFRAKIMVILQNNDVKKAGLFGSFARGDATKKSDIDLLIEFKGKKSLLDLAGLKLELEETFGRKVDIVTYNSLRARKVIKYQIGRRQSLGVERS